MTLLGGTTCKRASLFFRATPTMLGFPVGSPLRQPDFGYPQPPPNKNKNKVYRVPQDDQKFNTLKSHEKTTAPQKRGRGCVNPRQRSPRWWFFLLEWVALKEKAPPPQKNMADWQRLCDPMQVLAGGVASDVDEGEVNFEGAMWRVLRGNCVMAARRSWRFWRLRWMR